MRLPFFYHFEFCFINFLIISLSTFDVLEFHSRELPSVIHNSRSASRFEYEISPLENCGTWTRVVPEFHNTDEHLRNARD
jgi:hypothetical protein